MVAARRRIPSFHSHTVSVCHWRWVNSSSISETTPLPSASFNPEQARVTRYMNVFTRPQIMRRMSAVKEIWSLPRYVRSRDNPVLWDRPLSRSLIDAEPGPQLPRIGCFAAPGRMRRERCDCSRGACALTRPGPRLFYAGWVTRLCQVDDRQLAKNSAKLSLAAGCAGGRRTPGTHAAAAGEAAHRTETRPPPGTGY